MMDSSAVWNGQDPTLSMPSQDDFQFLDIGNLNFDFQDFHGQQEQQMIHQNGAGVMDMRMDNSRGGMAQQDTIMQEHIPTMTSASTHASISSTSLAHANPMGDSIGELDAQIQYLQQQKHQHQQRQLQEQQRNYYAQNRPIPPTPNSVEMHSGGSQFYSQSDVQQQAMFERYQMQVKEQEQMAFTPLVSPAVTPLEAHFNIPEYTVPGAYFSPLSSPALHAQNEHSSAYDHMQTGTTNSPIDMTLETQSAPGSSSILAKKRGKPAQKPRTTRPSVRQSPIVKPRRRKAGSTTMSSQALGDIIEPPNTHLTAGNLITSSATSTETSENGSISPEHLSDMAPPPVPRSNSIGQSPNLTAQNQIAILQRNSKASPATPASLMRITKSPNTNQPNPNADIDLDDQAMDGFALPEAASFSRPDLPRLDTQSDGQTTPTLASSSAQTVGLQPLPSPAFPRPRVAASASQSPQIEAMNGGATRKTPLLAARTTKKRGSVSSVHASPALRPRVSPSIKPLLPGGGSVSTDTASLLLASKSNYQNILEGTHLPGVSYPSELSTNLTSKRTSHKIAEQGRRNRINSALQEIATLLPKVAGKDSGCEKSGDGGDQGESKCGGQSASSKASTVEQAIEYIKQLQTEVAAANKRAEEAEKLLETKT
ncbi:helix-loop-helix DNA-binding domain-containing protein [Phlyctema vagabunda]|uniref:Helix-loop-helix DNA-binding domain-containing protein n=1 Tax=Phlyctema vagabunda TaxID=108571 RepID=A0ABR4PK65_9HELO